MSMITRKHYLPGVLLAAVLSAHADPGQIAVATDLKSAPDAGSASLGKLPAGQPVQIGERQGAWYQVKTSQGDGWVRMLNVRMQGNGAARGESTMSGLAALGQASHSNTTVATGVRGLSREDLQAAHENLQDVARLGQYQASADEARQFGLSAGLPAPRR